MSKKTTVCDGHHWIIAPATGPTSEGKCNKCKVVKTFYNSINTSSDMFMGNYPKKAPVENLLPIPENGIDSGS